MPPAWSPRWRCLPARAWQWRGRGRWTRAGCSASSTAAAAARTAPICCSPMSPASTRCSSANARMCWPRWNARCRTCASAGRAPHWRCAGPAAWPSPCSHWVGRAARACLQAAVARQRRPQLPPARCSCNQPACRSMHRPTPGRPRAPRTRWTPRWPRTAGCRGHCGSTVRPAAPGCSSTMVTGCRCASTMANGRRRTWHARRCCTAW